MSIEQFFDGNDDPASIGCNLSNHPGIDLFREIFLGIAQRADVESVYAQIAELEPDERYWPFTDTIWVAGEITMEDLKQTVALLDQDDVGPGDLMGAPQELLWKYSNRLLGVWWD